MQSHQKVFRYKINKENYSSFFWFQTLKVVIRFSYWYESLRARLSDAEFFYEKDLTTTLDCHMKALVNVVFQQELGSLEEKHRGLQS